MNVAIYLYDGYYETEIAPLGHIFRNERLFTVAREAGPVTMGDGRRAHADRGLDAVDPADIDILVLPGGKLVVDPRALELVRACADRGVWVGGICAGVDLMARAGILSGRRFTSYYEPGKAYEHLPADGVVTFRNLEVDGHLVTASYHAYLEFALTLGLHTGAVAPSDIEGYVQWFKRPLDLDTRGL